ALTLRGLVYALPKRPPSPACPGLSMDWRRIPALSYLFPFCPRGMITSLCCLCSICPLYIAQEAHLSRRKRRRLFDHDGRTPACGNRVIAASLPPVHTHRKRTGEFPPAGHLLPPRL